jgi:hypothetical protein
MLRRHSKLQTTTRNQPAKKIFFIRDAKDGSLFADLVAEKLGADG